MLVRSRGKWFEEPQQATIRRGNGSKRGEVPRCQAVTKGPGAGYSSPHQCASQAFAEYNGAMLCRTHIRQRVRQTECPK